MEDTKRLSAGKTEKNRDTFWLLRDNASQNTSAEFIS